MNWPFDNSKFEEKKNILSIGTKLNLITLIESNLYCLDNFVDKFFSIPKGKRYKHIHSNKQTLYVYIIKALLLKLLSVRRLFEIVQILYRVVIVIDAQHEKE